MPSNKPKLVPKLLAEADGYTLEQAASIYVDHVEGYPTLEKNCLLVGPLGSGKTIMLKAVHAQQAASSDYHPAFVELTRWIGHIAGETVTYGPNQLTPRAQVLREAMSLMVIVGLCDAASAFRTPDQFPALWSQFPPAMSLLNGVERLTYLKRVSKEALLTNELSDDFPSVPNVASALGQDIRESHGKKLVFLVDQIDQVGSQFFPPIVSLLKRSGDYISILATRPCPTAPHAEVPPRDVIAGDSYSILHLGRTVDGKIPYDFVQDFLEALPLQKPIQDEIKERATLIANLMWPSMRSAVEAIVRFVHFRANNVPSQEAWFRALADTAKSYEAVLKSALRGWCNPTAMLKDWRDKILASRTRIGRSNFLLPTNLVGDLKSTASERLIRMLLKNGVLLIGPSDDYIPGSLPRVCEIAPLLLVNTPHVDLRHFAATPTTIPLSEKQIQKWLGGGPPPSPSIKRVFISYRMEDPGEKTPLIGILKSKFKSTIEIITGEDILGSPRWSPEILERIAPVDLVLCDLTVPRRNVFVEYGVAIGMHVYVTQCVSRENLAEVDLPVWVTHRQLQKFSVSGASNDEFSDNVAGLLESEQNLKLSWRLDSQGEHLDVPRKEKRISCIGPETSGQLLEKITAQARESDFDFRFYPISKHRNDLDVVIKAARSSSTLLLIFEGTMTDYLTCVAGGILAAKPGRSGSTRMLLLDIGDGSGSVVPSLLVTHPLAHLCHDLTDLHHRFHERLEDLRLTPKRRSRATK